MSRLKDLSNDKVTIMMRILSSQNLCKAIKYNDSNFLDKPDIADPSELIYVNVFPYKRIPHDEDTTSKTYITMSFQQYKPVGNYFKSGVIYLNAIVNLDNMKTDYGMIRTDYIISEIDELINQERGIGIGKTNFYKMDDIVVNKEYIGTTIGYEIYEFN